MPFSHPTWYAHSYSRTLAALLSPGLRSFRVFSTHTHACNLVSAPGEWIALVDTYHDNGPFHVVVPAAVLSMLRVNERVEMADEQFHFAHGCLDLRSTTQWEPCLPCLSIEGKQFSWLHEETERFSTTSLAFTPALAHIFVGSMAAGIERLSTGLQQGDRAQICAGVQKIAGLGPGLTPAGDDFLLGLMAALTMQALPRLAPKLATGPVPQSFSANDLCTLIGTVAAQQTTRLSTTWLQYTAKGEFGAPWHDLAQALISQKSEPLQQAARRILATGATSGRAALAGFVCAVALALPTAD